MLTWPRLPIGIVGCLAYRATSPAGPWECLNADRPRPAESWRDNVLAVAAKPGISMYYKLTAIAHSGTEIGASEPVQCAALPAGAENPILSLDFTGDLAGGSWGGQEAVEEVNGVPAAHLKDGSHIVLPHRPEFNLDAEMTIELWAKLESPGIMPVLLCHGSYVQDGYFLQILSGKVRFYLHGVGVVNAGTVQPGKWYHIAGTYDGSEMIVFVNGEPAGRYYGGGRMTPCSRSLYIGRYDVSDRQYETDCRITGVRIYAAALLPEDVRAKHQRLAGKLR
jgi:hypothetical protein